ncbi:putative electron transporter [Cinnamomum micranthum f. kanehirae]|uniref:Putative electron transporter n=1 Tax=Cinnamomum micranthum f. kanehirae TaxID=337451 RepID=A0A3S3R7L9_9MAGN|nr:putative electron transporter [Cinnamomum micranthum f. kanehirae]
MGFGSEMQAVKLQDSSLRPFSCNEVLATHKRSKSCPDDRVNKDGVGVSPRVIHRMKLDMGKVGIDVQNKHSPSTKLQSSLKKEILQLERRLQDQFAVRQALEKALGYRSSSNDISNENSMPKVPTKELIKEIAVLELEVMFLEQNLLSLYRKAFDQHISSLSPSNNHERLRSPSIPKEEQIPKEGQFLKVAGIDKTSKRENPAVQVQSSRVLLPRDPVIRSTKESNSIGAIEKLIDPGVQRSHSSLSHRSICSIKNSPPVDYMDKSLRAFHSQPLSWLEQEEHATSDVISLAEHLGTRISDHVPETPNRLSEDVIRCMGAIYCKLADPPLVHHGLSSSPSSSLSSTSAFSPQDHCDMWSPRCRKEFSFDIRLENPSQVEGLKETSGPYSMMIEIPWICRDGQRLSDVEPMVQNFRSLVHRLEKVDPSRMKNDEKLAFWINIHNALVMHAYLAYGIPQNSMKRGSLLVKAAYNVGGRVVSADTIQSSILGCRTQRPGQWLRTFFSPRMKFKSRDNQKSYALDEPEPLLHFALCSGSHSDPPVRIYTAKRVFQELDAAKEEYIQATIGIRKEQKILVPKIIDYFAKDSSLSSSEVVDMIQHYLPETQRKAMQRCHQGKSRKNIEWVSHDFAFRYLLSKDLAK